MAWSAAGRLRGIANLQSDGSAEYAVLCLNAEKAIIFFRCLLYDIQTESVGIGVFLCGEKASLFVCD